MPTLDRRLGTAEVARRAGCSVQQVRNLERDGVLETPGRTRSGYRIWTDAHARDAATYVVLAAAVGPVDAKTVLRTARAGAAHELLALVDAAHARLHAERLAVGVARDAVAAIGSERLVDVRADDSMTISELAGALGVPTSTLRYWESEGLLVPARTARGRIRSYAPADVRDARVVRELRLAGYRIPSLRALMPTLRQRGKLADVASALQAREASIDARSRALLLSAAGLLAAASLDTAHAAGASGGGRS